MKIGIVTFHSSCNYGAVLQAYALFHVLKSMGHEPAFVDYLGCPQNEPRYRMYGIHPSDIVQRRKFNDFNAFMKKNCVKTDKSYESVDALRADPPAFDAFICGSDQIWNPELLIGQKLDPVFLLDFVPEGVARISYAASFGADSLDSSFLTELKSCLSKFSALSVRESPAATYIKDVVGLECETVMDPAFLLEDYNDVMPSTTKSSGKIVCYLLQRNDEIYDAVSAYQKAAKKAVLNIYGSSKFWTSPGQSVRPSPEEWLGLLRDADTVITNSFHGVAFSIIMQRDFVVLPSSGQIAKRSGRINELLGTLGLQERQADSLAVDELLSIREKQIDWNLVSERLRDSRERSLLFLQNALRAAETRS